MRERPILFSVPMVRALLEGRKTQTRRIVKPQPALETVEILDMSSTGWVWRPRPRKPEFRWNNPCPESDLSRAMSEWRGPEAYAHPGDRLWVRETWQAVYDCPAFDCEPDAEGCTHRRVVYRATEPNALDGFVSDRDGEERPTVWRPSLFMRRADSRITLEVTSVRVERLHDISEDDARAEGVTEPYSGEWIHNAVHVTGRPLAHGFFILWNEINGRESWDRNPWLWVIEFRRVADAEGRGRK